MRFQAPIIATLGFITVASSAPAALPAQTVEVNTSSASPLVERQSYTLDSFTTSSCGGGGRKDNFNKNCSKLKNNAKSIKMVSNLPSGCVLYGYSDDKCSGYNNIFILGPTSTSQCYKTLPDAKTEAQTTIKSVKLQC